MAVEMPLFEPRPRSLPPAAVASAVAGVLRLLITEGGAVFPLQTTPIQPFGLVSCIVAGLLRGAIWSA